MPGVRIVTDSACDLTDAEVTEHGISVVPLSIRFGEDEYVDREELSTEAFYDKLATVSELPATAAPAPGLFEAAFRKAAAEGADTVVCINLSSQLSATMASAQNAARALEGTVDVRVLDSRSITGGQGTEVLEAAKAAEAGASADDIEALVADLSSRTKIFGALDTLEFLKKGGRIGGAQAMLGTLLSIKPVIDISTGAVQEAGKLRTRKKALVFLRDLLFEQDHVEHLVLCDGHAADVAELQELIAPKYPVGSYRMTKIGATIGAHGGPRVIGFSWIGA